MWRNATARGMIRFDMARFGVAWRDVAWHGVTWRSVAWRGMARLAIFSKQSHIHDIRRFE